MDLDAYVAEHLGEWNRLEHLSRRLRLTADEVDELVMLYQRTATHLSVIRSQSPDPLLVSRLSRGVLSARAALTRGSPFSVRWMLRFITTTFPLAVYRGRLWWMSVALIFTVTSMIIMGYVSVRPEVARLFVSEAEITSIVDSGFTGYYSQFQPQNFALFVWTNNAFLCARCLAAGILIVPVLYLLWVNGFNLGLMGGIMIGNGRAEVFVTYLLPHGLLELTAVYIAAGFGLRIGWAWIAPGALRTRGQALGEAAREGMVVTIGLVGVLAVAGLLEGFVTPASLLPPVIRVGIGAATLVGFLAYVFVRGRAASAEGARTDLDEYDRGADAPVA